jgi:hypothetical protein
MNATVTILRDVTADPAESSTSASDSFAAEVLALEQTVMELSAPEKAEPGTALRIDMDDAVWLGEAEKCSEGGGGFLIRVRLCHVLRDFETLARLAERFGTTAPREASKPTPEGSPVKV